MLDQMLDILAQVKANQEEMRRERDEPREAAPVPTDPPLPRRRIRESAIARVLALRRTGAGWFARTPFADREELATDNDDHAFWKVMVRSAITGLFLLTVFVIGLYQLKRLG